MTKIFALNPEIKFFKDYDFSKVDAKKCDEISNRCNARITASKILALALIVLSIVSVYFISHGVASLIAPLGVFEVLGAVSISVISIIPTYWFLRVGLGFLTLVQNRCEELIQLAKQRKVELLKV